MGLFLIGAGWSEAQNRTFCTSAKEAPSYLGPSGQWVLQFAEGSASRISYVRLDYVRGNALKILGDSATLIDADPNFKPRNPKYANYARFGLADAHCDYSVLLPKSHASLDRFKATLYFICEAGIKGTVGLYCK